MRRQAISRLDSFPTDIMFSPVLHCCQTEAASKIHSALPVGTHIWHVSPVCLVPSITEHEQEWDLVHSVRVPQLACQWTNRLLQEVLGDSMLYHCLQQVFDRVHPWVIVVLPSIVTILGDQRWQESHLVAHHRLCCRQTLIFCLSSNASTIRNIPASCRTLRVQTPEARRIQDVHNFLFGESVVLSKGMPVHVHWYHHYHIPCEHHQFV